MTIGAIDAEAAHAALGVVVAAAPDVGEPFSVDAVEALRRAIGADTASYAELRLDDHGLLVWVEAQPVPLPAPIGEAAEALCAHNPLRELDFHDAPVPLSTSDRWGALERTRNPFYGEVFRPLGFEHEIKLFLPSRDGVARSFSLIRDRRGREFDGRARIVLELLRPHLARLRDRGPSDVPLTAREREVLDLVRRGYTNTEIAEQLWLSPHTVRTHLHNVFRKLGVATRTAAVAAVFGAGR